jgi:predicted phosphodiesterase
MLKIKKSRKDYNKIKINSDFHYGHDRDFLYIPLGFSSGKERSDWIDAQIASLDPNDLLICLGDVGLGIGADSIIDFIERIPCETLMVWGNHNSGVYQAYKNNLPLGFDNHEVYPLRIAKNVTMMGESFLLDVDRDRFFCTHMAPLVFHDQNRGRVCLCGHSHSNLKQINPDRDDFGKILDCGIENAKMFNGTAFFDIDEVVDILAKKKSGNLDHH